MKILAIDTSAVSGSCALLEDDMPIAVCQLNCGLKHSETMQPMIMQMLEFAGIEPAGIDLYAVSNGPGSFTGVRIGVSLIKGMAFQTGKPCIPVSTLEALALQCCGLQHADLIVPVMDARRGQVYTALFTQTHEGLKRLTQDSAISVKELSDRIVRQGTAPLFVGEGWKVAGEQCGLETFYCAPKPYLLQNAVFVGLTALRIYSDTKDPSVWTDRALAPSYLRPSQAERERSAKTAQSAEAIGGK